MRLKTLLWILLLATGLPAQNNCLIFDLTAEIVAPDPASCNFFVVLDFKHVGTTNQFTVHGNGNNYGTFPYGQGPLTLGPFVAGTTPSTLEFVVTDLIFQDCQEDVVIDVPPCGSLGSGCEIFDLTVQTGDCDPLGLTYELWIDFQVSNASNQFF